MTPPLYIALRFLSHRKRALLLSLSGVVFGVGIFICTQAQTRKASRAISSTRPLAVTARSSSPVPFPPALQGSPWWLPKVQTPTPTRPTAFTSRASPTRIKSCG